MTIIIDGHVITGTPEEIDTLLKFQKTSPRVKNIQYNKDFWTGDSIIDIVSNWDKKHG